MHHGKRVHDWGQTGSQMALLANVNRNSKRRKSPYPVSSFVPTDLTKVFRVNRGIRMTPNTLHALKPLFQKDK